MVQVGSSRAPALKAYHWWTPPTGWSKLGPKNHIALPPCRPKTWSQLGSLGHISIFLVSLLSSINSELRNLPLDLGIEPNWTADDESWVQKLCIDLHKYHKSYASKCKVAQTELTRVCTSVCTSKHPQLPPEVSSCRPQMEAGPKLMPKCSTPRTNLHKRTHANFRPIKELT